MNAVINPVAIEAIKPFQMEGGGYRFPSAQFVRTELYGEPVFFTVSAPRDVIQQKFHGVGNFYEKEELEIVHRAFKPGGLFVDIGSNVGNHALYVAKFLHPSEVVVVEPNPIAYKVLLSNLFLNRVEHLFDLNWIGHGISETEGDSFGMTFRMINIGGGRMVEGEGSIPAVRADTIIGDRAPAMIKIDVEGMEMQVLRSLTKTVARCAPRIFIEVDSENDAEFAAWIADNGYQSVERYRRYRRNENHLLIHREDKSWSL
ncbi:hypothetical protein GCM10011363_18260 [Marivita lacus]|jgi:FkbM family methyltransferase|uniref:Methyltransferase FkbM domain-containing protein n=1 Tax=Marivita lacus TaxID=1323742 RepID=A0ABQ1KK79_9RHOB|nr:FkbM family methyltransferase [Marivita lacus]GGC02010.1 hypothetical protein GCM10011363_18260 [Marivita lacus]